MWTLYKKEINGFFSSLTGYLVIGVFLLLIGLFTWLIPGQFSVPDSGYASLDGLFSIAPWVFLFLVPAITMRMFAEEKRSGTMELLMTRPVSEPGIIIAKFLASWTLVLLALLPTLVFFWSVSRMGSPVGNVDAGAVWGSYIGLLMLGGIYTAIGIFSSSLSSNQMISFIVAVTLSFFLYLGFDLISSLADSGQAELLIAGLGIEAHYASMSRGVLDSRDLLYFLSMMTLFLALVRRRRNYIAGVLVVLLIAVGLNLLSLAGFFRVDLTAEKRHSLSPASKELLGELEEEVYIRIYLDGELPSAFEHFRKSISELMQEFRARGGARVRYEFINLYQEEDQQVRDRIISSLYERGLEVTSVQVRDREGGNSSRMIFPGAMMAYRSMEVPVNLLKNNPALPHEQNLNNSAQMLEYEFVRALGSLVREEVPRVAFIEGHGELDSLQTHSFMDELKNFYQVDRGFIGGHVEALLNYEALIIARPQRRFSDADLYALDQYLMSGGKLIFLLDPVNPFADSLQGGTTIGMAVESGLEDLLFRYGFRINYDLLSDLQCSYVPVNVAPAGQQSRFNMMPWVYYPLLAAAEEHPVGRGLNYVFTPYASSLDTLGAVPGLKRSVLLATSEASRRREVPVYISMEEITRQPNPALFKQGPFPVAVLAEGYFESFYRNYPVPEGVSPRSWEPVHETSSGAVFVMSDGDVAANEVEFEGGRYLARPLGYDPYTRQTFGNGEFLMNLVNFMSDDTGIMELRSREFRLRLLNKEILNSRSALLRWRLLNILLPLVLVALLAILIPAWRRRRFTGGTPNILIPLLLSGLLLPGASSCASDTEKALRGLPLEGAEDMDRIILVLAGDSAVIRSSADGWLMPDGSPANPVAIDNLRLALADLEVIASESLAAGEGADGSLLFYSGDRLLGHYNIYERDQTWWIRPAGHALQFRVRIASWPDLDPAGVIRTDADHYRQQVLFSLAPGELAAIDIEDPVHGHYRFLRSDSGHFTFEPLRGVQGLEGRELDQEALGRLFSYPGSFYFERPASEAEIRRSGDINTRDRDVVKIRLQTRSGGHHLLEVRPLTRGADTETPAETLSDDNVRADLFRALVRYNGGERELVMNYLLLDVLIRPPQTYFQ